MGDQNAILVLFQIKLIGESDFTSVARWACWYLIPELDGLSPQWHSETAAGLPNKVSYSPPGSRQTKCSFGGGSRPERRGHSRAEPSMVRCASQTFPFSCLWVQWLRRQREVMSVLVLSLVEIRELLLSMDIWMGSNSSSMDHDYYCCSCY